MSLRDSGNWVDGRWRRQRHHRKLLANDVKIIPRSMYYTTTTSNHMIQVYLTFFRSAILSQTLSYLSEATSSQLCRNICECLHMRRCSSWYTSVAARSTTLHASVRSTELSRSLNGLCDKRFRRSNDHTRALVSSRLVSPSATTLHYIDSRCPAMPPCLDCHRFTNDTAHASIKL